MSYDAVVAARRDAEAKMTDSVKEGIRLGLEMKRAREAAKASRTTYRNPTAVGFDDWSGKQDQPEEDAFMLPPYGAQPVPVKEWVAANDNEAWPMQDVPPPNGQYIGLTRRAAEITDSYDGDLVTTTFAPLDHLPQKRTGEFMQTCSGREFWPADPRPDEVHIEDVAHSLSLQCRYAGHCIRFYSVAEHSILIARWLLKYHGPTVAIHGLLHDATEAYLVDVPRPAKASLPDYKRLESSIWSRAIAPRFGLMTGLPDAVHEADNRIIADELVNLRWMEWHSGHDDPLGVALEYMSPDRAETEFLALYVRLERMVRGVGGMV